MLNGTFSAVFLCFSFYIITIHRIVVFREGMGWVTL